MNPKSVSLTRMTFERGRRLIFGHDKILDLNSVFELRFGHGNPQVRGRCSIDFFEISRRIDELSRTVYDLEVTMQRPDRTRFGILFLSFQIFPLRELEEIRSQPRMQVVVPPTAGQRVIIRPVKSARGNFARSKKDEEAQVVKSPKSMRRAQSSRPWNKRGVV